MFGTLGNIGVLNNGKATFVYYLDHDAPHIDIRISDDHGQVVYRQRGMKFAGRNELVWNGRNNEGKSMPEGTYRISVKAADADGRPVTSKTYTAGKVTMNGRGDIAGLAFGKIVVPLDRVLAIRELSNV